MIFTNKPSRHSRANPATVHRGRLAIVFTSLRLLALSRIRQATVLMLLSVFSVTAWAIPTTDYPADGSTLSGSTQTFALNAGGLSISDWWIFAGSAVGARDYRSSGNLGSGLVHEISGLPEDGSTVYVRLWYRESATSPWAYNDLTFTAQIPSTPYIVRPVPANSRMTGRAVAFTWNDNGYGATHYSLDIGFLPGYEYYTGSFDNIYYSGVLTSRSVIVDDLPVADGTYDDSMYVVLYAKRPGEEWLRVDDDILQMYNPNLVPSIDSPAPDNTLPGSSANFTWSANNVPVTAYWIYVGASLGGRQYYDSGNLGTNLSHTISTLPTDGSEVYVRLWYRTGGKWRYSDEQYKASGIGPQIITPSPGLFLEDSPVQFDWTDNGIGVVQWWLYSGYSPGGKNYHDSGNLGAATSDLVMNEVPGTGEDYTVRLWFRTSPTGFWKHTDFTYWTID